MDNIINKLIEAAGRKEYCEYDFTSIKSNYKKHSAKTENYSYSFGSEEGICIRVIDAENRFAQASSTCESWENIFETIEYNLNLSISLKQKYLYNKRESLVQEIPDIYDKKLEKEYTISSKECFQTIIEKLKNLGLSVIEGTLVYIEEEYLYYNPVIQKLKYKRNKCILFLLLEITDIIGNIHHYTYQSDIKTVNIYSILCIYNEILVEIFPYLTIKPENITPDKYNISFSNVFFNYIFSTFYLNEFFHKNRINKEFSNYLSIYDDGTISGGYGSKPFDSEGTVTGKTSLVENGVKVGSLVPVLQAVKYNLLPTGNMNKEYFFSKPKLSYNNLIFDIKSKFKGGKYIYINTCGTGEFTNIFSSDFNVMREGTKTVPLNKFFFELDFEKMFSKIEAIGGMKSVLGIYSSAIIFKHINILG